MRIICDFDGTTTPQHGADWVLEQMAAPDRGEPEIGKARRQSLTEGAAAHPDFPKLPAKGRPPQRLLGLSR